MNKSYCFHIRNMKDEKIIGGMLHSDSMENVAKSVIKMSELEIREIVHSVNWKTYHLYKDNKEVYLYISVHPEHLNNERKSS